MDDTPEPVEAQLVPLSPRTAATIDQVQQPQLSPFARSRTLPSIFYNAQMDFPAHIQKSVMDVQAAFEAEDWTYFLGGDAWFRLNLKLDMIMAWVSSQVDAKGILRGQLVTVFDDYRDLDDTVEDSLDLPYKKVERIGAAMQIVGMALKEKDSARPEVPGEKMLKLFRFADKDPSITAREIEKYGVLQVAADWVENFVNVGLDIFCVVDSSRSMYPYGCGKTTLMLELCAAAAKALDYPFDLRRDVAYTIDVPRVQRFLEDNRKEQVRGVDEMKTVWSRRTAMAGQQKRDMQVLSTVRKNRQIWVGVIDNIFRADFEIFEGKATHLLRVQDPGWRAIPRGWNEAILYEKADDDEEQDRWGRMGKRIRWGPLPSKISAVYSDCVDYTNAHARLILDKDHPRSPLDELLDEDRTWKLKELGEWAGFDSLDEMDAWAASQKDLPKSSGT